MPSLVDHRHRPAVRDQPERVSAFIRNRCPGSSGIGVRKQPDYSTRGCGHHRSICRLERRVVHLASQDRHLMKQDHDLDREVRISATDEADQL